MAELAPEIRDLLARIEVMLKGPTAAGPQGGGTFADIETLRGAFRLASSGDTPASSAGAMAHGGRRA